MYSVSSLGVANASKSICIAPQNCLENNILENALQSPFHVKYPAILEVGEFPEAIAKLDFRVGSLNILVHCYPAKKHA